TLGVGTDGAGVGLGEVEAGRALDDAFLHPHDGLGQTPRLVSGTAQDEEGEPLGSLGADARQLGELFDERRYRRRGGLHVISVCLIAVELCGGWRVLQELFWRGDADSAAAGRPLGGSDQASGTARGLAVTGRCWRGGRSSGSVTATRATSAAEGGMPRPLPKEPPMCTRVGCGA